MAAVATVVTAGFAATTGRSGGKGSPAQAAGLHSGDIILGLAGRPVQNIPDLQRVLGEIPVGEAAAIDILRRTHRLSIDVVPSEAPA